MTPPPTTLIPTNTPILTTTASPEITVTKKITSTMTAIATVTDTAIATPAAAATQGGASPLWIDLGALGGLICGLLTCRLVSRRKVVSLRPQPGDDTGTHSPVVSFPVVNDVPENKTPIQQTAPGGETRENDKKEDKKEENEEQKKLVIYKSYQVYIHGRKKRTGRI